jgi:hypothetical protein
MRSQQAQRARHDACAADAVDVHIGEGLYIGLYFGLYFYIAEDVKMDAQYAAWVAVHTHNPHNLARRNLRPARPDACKDPFSHHSCVVPASLSLAENTFLLYNYEQHSAQVSSLVLIKFQKINQQAAPGRLVGLFSEILFLTYLFSPIVI